MTPLYFKKSDIKDVAAEKVFIFFHSFPHSLSLATQRPRWMIVFLPVCVT